MLGRPRSCGDRARGVRSRNNMTSLGVILGSDQRDWFPVRPVIPGTGSSSGPTAQEAGMSNRVVRRTCMSALRPAHFVVALALAAAFAGAAAPPALAKSDSAAGAPIGDLLWASGVAVVLSAAVLWLAIAHRSGRIFVLQRIADAGRRATGLPGWAIVPVAVGGASLLIAVFGFYWDVAKHIDTGRDAGPFGTVAHYPILVGLAGIALAGFLAIVLGASEELPTAVRVRDGWHAPLGGLLIFLCGCLALTGFPLD